MKAKPIYALLFFVLMVICYRVFGYTGHFGYDDMQYAELAAGLLKGEVDFDDHFTFRFPVIAATALSYQLFGINDFASSLPAMVLTILTLVIVYAMLRRHGLQTTVLGLGLTATSQFILLYSNKLMPDIYLAFFTLTAAWFYYRDRYESPKHTVLNAVAFAMSLWFGFMSKGTVVLLLPWLLYLFVADCLQKRNGKFWRWATLTGAVCLMVYFAAIKLMTGEFFYRFKSIAQNSYLNTCSYDQQPIAILLKRLYHDFFDMTVTSGMAVPMVCVVAAFISRKGRQLLRIPDGTSFFVVSAMLLFLSSNFMTISATSYVPMCVDPRHYLFIVPVAAIATALFLRQRPTRVQVYSVAVLFAALSIYVFFHNRDAFYHIYLPITMVATAAAVLQHCHVPGQYFSGAVLTALMVLPLKMMTDSSYGYIQRRDSLIALVVNNDQNALVVSDKVCTRMMRYYSGFSSNDKYMSFDDINEETANTHRGRVALVLNYHTLALDGLTFDNLPDFAHKAYLTLTPEFDHYDVKLYGLDGHDLTIPHYDTLFCSINRFEGDSLDYWNNDILLTRKTSHSGIQSNETGTYSATFSYPLDSLRSANCDTVFITVSAQCNCFAPSNCAVVVSIENADSTLSWSSSGIGNSMRAYSHWFPVEYKKELHLGQLPAGTRAFVYFFKTDDSPVYIDDFSVCFCTKVSE